MPGEIVHGQVYKWTDAQGQTHYSDQPPPNSQRHETIQVFESAGESSQSSAPDEELERIRQLTRELAAAREARERERREKQLAALERAYYQQMLEEERREREQENEVLYPLFPYQLYPPISHPPIGKFHNKQGIKGHSPGHPNHFPRHRIKEGNFKGSSEHPHFSRRQAAPRPRVPLKPAPRRPVEPRKIKSQGILSTTPQKPFSPLVDFQQ